MIGIYCRVSKDRENQKSTHEQKLQGIAYAQKKGAEYKVYIDEDVSGGASIEDRPAFYELLDDLANGVIDTIWFDDQSRMERSGYTYHLTMQYLNRYNGRLVIGNELKDINDPDTRLMMSVMSAMNEHQLQMTSYKIKRVLKRNAQEGRAFSNNAFGYMAGDGGKLVINEEEAPIVRRIYELYISGKGIKRIADILNADGVPTKYNKLDGTIEYTDRISGRQRSVKKKDVKWSEHSVRGILRNSIYKGERKWGNEVYPAPIIIEESVWIDAQDKMDNSIHSRGRKSQFKYLLKGKIICGVCDSNYYGRTRKAEEGKAPRDHYYMCSSKRYKHKSCDNRSIHIDRIEELIWGMFGEYGMLPDLIKKYFKETNFSDKIEELNNEIERKEKEINESVSQIQEYAKLFSLKIWKVEEVTKLVEEERHKKSLLELTVGDLKSKLHSLKQTQSRQDKILSDLTDTKRYSFEEKRALIEEYLKYIHIHYSPNGGLFFKGGEFFLDICFNLPQLANPILVVSKDYKEMKVVLPPKDGTVFLYENIIERCKEIMKHNGQ